MATNRDYITVEELNFYINNVFLNEELLHNVPVVGEVSGTSFVNGHCYFTLKDQKAQIKCVFFSCPADSIPVNGAKVLVRGSVDYYAKGGQINLKVYAIVNVGVGLLHEQFEKLRKKLEEEGLFREDHKKEIPPYPKRVAVVTSVKGAAVQDFITTVRRYNEMVDISVVDVRVQGEYAARDVVEALTNADVYGFDVIVLARGGGSFEDLFCFNDESIVRTIYRMKTPIISAIGHETDYTLCDYVADKRAITPTAAAEIIGYSATDMKNNVQKLAKSIALFSNALFKNKVDVFVDLCDEVQLYIKKMVLLEQSKIMKLTNNIKIFTNVAFEEQKKELSNKLSILESLNPLKLLNKGYFRILKDDKYIYNTNDLQDDDEVTIVGSDGKVKATINRDGE